MISCCSGKAWEFNFKDDLSTEKAQTAKNMLQDDDTKWPNWVSDGNDLSFKISNDQYQLISALEIANSGLEKLKVTIEDSEEIKIINICFFIY